MRRASEYVRNVKATLYPGRWSKKATVLAFLLTYVWLFALTTNEPLAQFYAGLLTSGVLVALVHPATRDLNVPGARIRGTRDDPGIAYQFVWVPVILLVFAFGYVLFGYSWRALDWTKALRLFALHVLLIAPVEGFLAAWLWPQILPYGPVTAALLFAALHVAKIAQYGAAFFVAAFTMALVFWLFLYLREVLSDRWRRYFGFMATNVVHGTGNTISLLFVVFIGPLELVPFAFGG